MTVFPRHYVRSQSLSQGRQLAFGRAAVDKLEQAQTFVVSRGDHSSQGRIDSLRKQRRARLRIRWRFAKNLRKRFSKTALRFKAAAVSRLFHAATLPHLAQRKAHSARAMISLKGHSIMPFELTARGRGIDRQRRQFLVCEPPARGALDLRTETLDQFGRTLVWIHRVAAQTGTITADQRLTRCREEIDVLACWLFRRTGRPAENSRRTHSDKKYAFKTRIAVHQRAIHRFGRRKKFQCFHV